MWMIVAILVLIAGMFFASEMNDGSFAVLGLVVGFAILAIAEANNSPDHIRYDKEQIISVVQKVSEDKFIVELQRDGYTESQTIETTVEYKDSPEKDLTTPKELYTDKWVLLWDREHDGQKIISFPLDEIKLVK